MIKKILICLMLFSVVAFGDIRVFTNAKMYKSEEKIKEDVLKKIFDFVGKNKDKNYSFETNEVNEFSTAYTLVYDNYIVYDKEWDTYKVYDKKDKNTIETVRMKFRWVVTSWQVTTTILMLLEDSDGKNHKLLKIAGWGEYFAEMTYEVTPGLSSKLTWKPSVFVEDVRDYFPSNRRNKDLFNDPSFEKDRWGD